MLPEFITEEFIEKFEQKVTGYSQMFYFPLKAELLEEVIYNALKETGTNSEWEPSSHKKGTDIEVPDSNEAMSIKSGIFKLKNDPELSISSHRSTTYETLAEKIEFFDGDGKNYSSYLVLAREEDEKDKKRIYQLLYIPANFITASSLDWVKEYNKKGKHKGWATKKYKKHGVKIEIRKAMSDQFWIFAKKRALQKNSKVVEICSFEFDYDYLGKLNSLLNKEETHANQ